MPNFTQLQEINTGPVGHVALCPKRDVIALVLGDGNLVIYRFSVSNRSHERLYPSTDNASNPRSDTTPSGPITSIAWSPNGNTLALGYIDGSLFLMDVESNYVRAAAIDVSSRGKARHSSTITHISWSSQFLNDSNESVSNYSRKVSERTSSKYNRDIEFLLPSIRSCNDKRSMTNGGKQTSNVGWKIGEISSDEIDNEQEGMLALIAADSNGMVSVSVGQGRYHILSLHMNQFISPKKSSLETEDKSSSSFLVLGATMSPSLDSLSLMVSSSSSSSKGVSSDYDLRMIDVSTNVMSMRRFELQLIARKVSVFFLDS